MIPGGDEGNQEKQDDPNLRVEKTSYQGPVDTHPQAQIISISEKKLITIITNVLELFKSVNRNKF